MFLLPETKRVITNKYAISRSLRYGSEKEMEAQRTMLEAKEKRGRKTMLKINIRAASSVLRIEVKFGVYVRASGSMTYLTCHQWGLTQREQNEALAQGKGTWLGSHEASSPTTTRPYDLLTQCI